MPSDLDLVVVSDCVLDAYYVVDELPVKAGDFVVSRRFALSPGGACAAAVVAAKLGLEVAVMDRVGNDPFSESLLEALGEAGVRTDLMRRVPGHATVSNNILAEGGGHAFLGHLGVGASLAAGDLDGDAIGRARAVLINGTLAALSPGVADALRAAARAARGLAFLDPGPIISGEVRQLAGEVDVVLPNEREAEALLGGPIEAVGPGRTFVVKLGGGGAAVASGGRVARCAPSRPGRVVTTVGAGDAFDAGYIAGALMGLDPEAACGLANRVAAIRLERLTPMELPDLRHALRRG